MVFQSTIRSYIPYVILLGLLLSVFYFNNLADYWAGIVDTPRAYLSLTVAISLMVGYVLIYLPSSAIRFGKATVYFGLYVGYVSWQVAFYPDLSGDSESYTLLVLLGLLYLVFQPFAHQLSDYRLTVCFVGMGTVAAGHGLGQYFGLLPPPSSNFAITASFNNPGPYAGYLVSLLPWTLAAVANRRLKLLFWSGCLALASVSLALILTQSRAAWLAALSIGAFMTFPRWRGYLASLRRKWMVAVGLAISTLLTGLVYFKLPSALGRLLIWQVSGQAWQNDPLEGAGYGRFPIAYREAQAAYFASNSNAWAEEVAGSVNYAFNWVVQSLVETGLVGTTLLLVWVGFLLNTLTTNSTAWTAMLAILLFGLFSYPFRSVPIYTNFILAAAMITATSSKQLVLPSRFWARSLAGFVIIVCVVIATQQYHIGQAIQRWQRTAALVKINPDAAFRQYQEVYLQLDHYGPFLYNYGTELSEAKRYGESIGLLNQAERYFSHIDLLLYQGNNYRAVGDYTKAEAFYQRAAHLIPNRFYPKYLLMDLYRQTEQYGKALAVAQEIVHMPVKIPSALVNRIRKEAEEFLDEGLSNNFVNIGVISLLHAPINTIFGGLGSE